MGFINRGGYSTGGGFNRNRVAPPVVNLAPPAPLPFMAVSTDKHGQPYYGEGYKGYARKLFASVFDPKFFVSRPTEQQASLIEQGGEKFSEVAGWTDFLEKWTGVKSEEIGQGITAMALAARGTTDGQVDTEKGVGETIQTGAQIAYRVGATAIKGGLDILGLADKAVRKGHASLLAVDDIGDASVILPDATPFDDSTRLGAFANQILRLTPVIQGYNALRAITTGGSIYDKMETVRDYQKGSEMVYTFFWDHAKKEEYLQRLEAGDNPDLIVRDLENIWVELAGSVFGDPTTYLGVGIIGHFGKASTPIRAFGRTLFKVPWETVGRIPGFTEIIGLKNIGYTRLLGVEGEFTKVADPVLEDALLSLEKATDNSNAISKIQKAVTAARKAAEDFRFEYGVFTPDSTAKAEIFKKTVGTVFDRLADRFRSVDDIQRTFRAFDDVLSNDPKVAAKSISYLKEVYGTLPFSNGGKTSLMFMNQLAKSVDIGTLAEKGDLPGMIKVMDNQLDNLISDFFPSVDDMEAAFKGAKDTARARFLSQSYEALQKTRPAVIISNNVHRALARNAVSRGLSSFFAGTFMGATPAYAIRNLQQNSGIILHDLGFTPALESLTTGAEVFAKSTAERLLKKFGVKTEWVARVMDRETKAIEKVLGKLPRMATRGIGPGEKGFGFLGVGSDIEKAHSLIITRYVAEREMEKFMRYGGIPSLDNIRMPKGWSERLYALAIEHNGDAKAVLKQFRQEQATGFFETWRSLELDPRFKDTLRRANLLDELEDIRKTARDASSFKMRMEQFTAKIEKLADRVRNEPSLVSESNPMAESVVLIEKAFEEGGKKIFSGDELNQFRALTQLYDDLRLQQSNNVRALYGRLANQIPPEAQAPFNQRFADIEEILHKGSTSIRGFVDEIYNGVYAESKKGVPASELWGRASGVMFDMQDGKLVLKTTRMAEAFPNINPAELTHREFNSMLWKWTKETQSSFWRSYNQNYLVQQDMILDEMAQSVGMTLDELKQLHFGDASNPQLKRMGDLLKQIQDWEQHLDFESFRKLEMQGKNLSDLTNIKADFPNWKGGRSHLFNAVNADRAARGLEPYATIDDVPYEEALSSLKNRQMPAPPYVESTVPTTARNLYENMQGGLREALQSFTEGTLAKWGEKVPVDTKLSDEVEEGIARWADELGKRRVSATAAASSIADETRNFILHDYNKTYADHFLSMFTMYHYWPSRTYMRSIERVIDRPGAMSAYLKWRSAMEREHADLPEYFRYNIPVGKLPGTDSSPYYINLEATLNPLYGLTGVDFNDPNKRVDWLSSAVDDMTKFGFNLAVPLQWLMAFHLFQKGEDDAARRWTGRLIPQTATVKAALNLLNDKTGLDLMPDIGPLPGAKYGEFDPFVNVFSGGVDPYEEGRVGRAMAAMITDGVPVEEAYDAMYTKDSPLYDEAVSRAINERGPGQILSYFLGIGYKTRTQGDVDADRFYKKYFQLLSLRNTLSPEDYKTAFNALKTEFPFADTLLLAKRGGDDRDAAYAYSILSRLPPGESYKLLDSMGVDTLDKFYDSKGDFSTWSKPDRDRFMAAMLDLGTTLTVPRGAVRQEWDAAILGYREIRAAMQQQFGEDIFDVTDHYYDLLDTNRDEANTFRFLHPEITASLQFKQEQIINNPLVYKYYGSFDTVESYYEGKMRARLTAEFGQDIIAVQNKWYDDRLDAAAEGRPSPRPPSRLLAYWDKKHQLEEEYGRVMVDFAGNLPEADPLTFRAGGDEDVMAAFQQQQSVPWEEWQSRLNSSTMESFVISYWMNGQELPRAAQSELDYIGSQYGLDGDEVLRLIGLSLQPYIQ